MSGRRRGETGQTLIFVLVLITSFAILATALLGAAGTSGVIAQQFNLAFRGREAADVGLEYGVDQVNENALSPTVNEKAIVLVPATVDGTVVSVQVEDVTITKVTISGPSCTVSGSTPKLVLAATAESKNNITNTVVPRSIAPVWTVDAQTPAATISQAGEFTAPTVSADTSYVVRVTYNNVTATKTITVKPAASTCP